jgi:pimeloyl-ACP methyl ester carboxylesterase
LAINVFLSVGRTISPAQETFVTSVESYLSSKGLRSRTVGRNEFTHTQPLRLVDRLMNHCAGTMVIALERIFIERAVERRGADSAQQIMGALTTPWNQIEAAFSFARKLPLLVIKEDSVREEGMLEGRYDWYVHSTKLDLSFLASREFEGTFESWRKEVKRRAGWFRCRNSTPNETKDTEMPRAVAVVFVHGINATDLNFAAPMRDLLTRALPRKLRSFVKYKSIFWADIVRGRSQAYLHQARSSTRMVDSAYRRLVVEGLGDAAAYQKTRKRDNSAYFAIQDRISQALEDANAGGDPERPLVIIGHSLGCHIASSYAWDINRLKQMSEEEVAKWGEPELERLASKLRSASPFRRLDTFAGFVTMGSNMPLFTFTFGPDRVFPITYDFQDGRRAAFPGQGLSAHTLAQSRWINFYSANDLLGYPLKPLNAAYGAEGRIEDRRVYSEGWLRAHLLPSNFNVMRAHLRYWRNPTVIRQSAALISRIMTADDVSAKR